MSDEKFIMGLFEDKDRAIGAIKGVMASSWKLERVHSPFPDHEIMDTLDLRKSKVGFFTLAGGIIGFFSGIGLAIFTATQWNIIVSGKPVVALVPFMIVGFEFTILFSVIGNITGLILQTRLPEFKSLKQYDPRCSDDHFGLLVSCNEEDREGLIDFLRKGGEEIRIIE